MDNHARSVGNGKSEPASTSMWDIPGRVVAMLFDARLQAFLSRHKEVSVVPFEQMGLLSL